MPHYEPIVLPVDSDSVSELGKVTGSVLAIAIVGLAFISLIIPILIGVYYACEYICARSEGYPFCWNPARSEYYRHELRIKNLRKINND